MKKLSSTEAELKKKKGVQNFDFLEKGLGLVSSPHFVNDFFKKNVSHVIFY